MDSPPTSTLSTPSPTELHDSDPVAAEIEKAEMLKTAAQQNLKPIFLVVAMTPGGSYISDKWVHRQGIGLNGTLPWPMVKADMQFFKNVTQAKPGNANQLSTVIMGRKTYFSIPEKFRPLDQRNNVILTRSAPGDMLTQIKTDFEIQQSRASEALEKKFGKDWRQKSAEISASTVVIDQKRLKVTQAEIKVQALENGAVSVFAANTAIPSVTVTNDISTAVSLSKGRVSCIGGAEIYNAFLTNKDLRPRLVVLQTEILSLGHTAYECDTFWPENLYDADNGWVEAERKEILSWIGIDLPQGDEEWLRDSEANVKLKVRGWKQQAES